LGVQLSLVIAATRNEEKAVSVKTKDVKLGAIYAVIVKRGALYPDAAVRLEHDHPDGGWTGTNLHTGRTVRIRSARRLQWEIAPMEDASSPEDAERLELIEELLADIEQQGGGTS
jgi:hypothetical protein